MIGAIVAGVVVLLDHRLRPLVPAASITIETYFNESVQGLDIGSKIKYRGVVDRRGDADQLHLHQVPAGPADAAARALRAGRGADPAAAGRRPRGAGDITTPTNAQMEVERGLRVRLAPQGITGTSYLEIDYVDPPPPVLPIDWTPDNIYIPSAPSTVTAFVNAAIDIMERLHKLDIEGTLANLNKLLVTTNERIAAVDTKELSQRADRTLAKIDTTLDDIADEEALRRGASRCSPSCAQTNAELKKTLVEPGVAEAARRRGRGGRARCASSSTIRSSPQSIAHLERTLARLDRILGGGEADLATTIENLRQITDNLRDLTEDAKRYPANVLFGAPPTAARATAMNPIRLACRARASPRPLARAARALLAHAAVAGQADVPARAAGAAGGRDDAAGARCAIGTVTVAAPFRGRTFVYREGDLRFETDFYDEFLVAPAPMIGEATARCARARGAFARVIPPGAPPDADFVLDGFVDALYADTRDARQPAAVLAITFYVTRTDARWRRLVEGYQQRAVCDGSRRTRRASVRWRDCDSPRSRRCACADARVRRDRCGDARRTLARGAARSAANQPSAAIRRRQHRRA